MGGSDGTVSIIESPLSPPQGARIGHIRQRSRGNYPKRTGCSRIRHCPESIVSPFSASALPCRAPFILLLKTQSRVSHRLPTSWRCYLRWSVDRRENKGKLLSGHLDSPQGGGDLLFSTVFHSPARARGSAVGFQFPPGLKCSEQLGVYTGRGQKSAMRWEFQRIRNGCANFCEWCRLINFRWYLRAHKFITLDVELDHNTVNTFIWK